MQPDESTLELLTRSFSSALERTDIDADSDFFALGGDSLTALRIAGSVAAELSTDDEIEALVIAALFEEPNLGAVAVLLDRHLQAGDTRGSGGG